MALIEVIKSNPFQNSPPYEKLRGELKEFYLRRINVQHRLVYQVFEEKNIVKIVSLWSHYEKYLKKASEIFTMQKFRLLFF